MQYFSTKLCTNDLVPMLQFYQEVLDLPITRNYETSILLGQNILITQGEKNGLYLETEAFHTLLEKLHNMQYPLSLRTTSAGQRIITTTDPAGNQVEIGEAMRTVIQRLLEE